MRPVDPSPSTYVCAPSPLPPPKELMASSPKLEGIDLSRLLTPAASLRPRAAQRCVTKQVGRPARCEGRRVCCLLQPRCL